MLGMLLSFFKTWIWLTYNIVEAAVLTLAFNYLAPRVNELYLTTWKLPFVHVTYWHVFAFFIVIHYVGNFIQTLTPKLFYYKNESNETPDKKSK
jgi:hypothetical protein